MQTSPIQFSAHRKILYAEDDKGLREAIAELLTKRACPEGDTIEITAVPDSLHAMTALREETFDMVITDNSMPVENEGIRVINLVKELAKNNPIVAMFSGDDRVADQVEDLGATFIGKHSPDKLLKFVQTELDKLNK